MEDHGESDAPIRLHVGGLARGVRSKDLAALIARALPEGAAPTAEIMRDQSTGIERGFGYVTVPGGKDAKDAAERAISAYNGTRWRGNRIRVGVAKGDYLERLKAEWKEAETAKVAVQAAASASAITAKGPANQKTRPVLRLRRRPGERIMLVDPIPIPWEKPANFVKTARSKRPRDDAKGAGDEADGALGAEEEEHHRRKRGVFGCKRRVVFPGREAACSTGARELWRRHLQEQAAEASASRLREVDRLISRRTQVHDTNAMEEKTSLGVENHSALSEYDTAESVPVEAAGDIEPEEPEGIEFVWDDDNDANDSTGDGHDDREPDREDEQQDEDEDVGDGEGEEDTGFDSLAEAYAEGVRSGHDSETRVIVDEGHTRPKRDKHTEKQGDLILSAAEGGREEAAVEANKALVKTQGRPGGRNRKHGVEIDDRLAELLSDGSDDEGNASGGGYDYELETAKKAKAAAVDGSSGVSLGRDTVEGMADRLQAETERSLNVLAELFGGEFVAKSAGNSAKTARPPPNANGTSEATAVDTPARSEDTRSSDNELETSNVRDISEDTTKIGGNGNGMEIEANASGEDRASSKDDDGGKSESPGNAAERSGDQQGERFVAHMSTLTDIFKVEDKATTKKNQAEKDKDKGFRVASLFEGLLPPTTTDTDNATQTTQAEGSSMFSFSLGDGFSQVNGQLRSGRAVENSGAASSEGGQAVGGQAPQSEKGVKTATPLNAAQSLDGPDAPPGLAPAPSPSLFWRPLDDVVAVAAGFVRAGSREDVEAAWIQERHALTQDFKRKYKDAVKGRRASARGGRGGGRGTRGGMKRHSTSSSGGRNR